MNEGAFPAKGYGLSKVELRLGMCRRLEVAWALDSRVGAWALNEWEVLVLVFSVCVFVCV